MHHWFYWLVGYFSAAFLQNSPISVETAMSCTHFFPQLHSFIACKISSKEDRHTEQAICSTEGRAEQLRQQQMTVPSGWWHIFINTGEKQAVPGGGSEQVSLLKTQSKLWNKLCTSNCEDALLLYICFNSICTCTWFTRNVLYLYIYIYNFWTMQNNNIYLLTSLRYLQSQYHLNTELCFSNLLNLIVPWSSFHPSVICITSLV